MNLQPTRHGHPAARTPRYGISERQAITRLTELLAAVSESADDAEALAQGAQHTVAALGADLVVVINQGCVTARAVRNGRAPADKVLLDLTAQDGERVGLGSLGALWFTVVPLRRPGMRLVVGRASGMLRASEIRLVRDLEQGFALGLRMGRATREERRLREQSERQAQENLRLLASLRERSLLLERLARIQRSISHHAPLQEVFDAITMGAQELLGPDVVGLRLLDPQDERMLVLISSCGVSERVIERMMRMPVGQGAGGRAVVEQQLVIIEHYDRAENVHPALAADGLQSAMAAPVHERGRIVGSLSVASYTPARRYSRMEQEFLLAFAEHASLALTDARTIADLREAQHAKELFLAMASHELKTPLTVIMGTLRTLECRASTLPDEIRTSLLSSAFQRGRDLERLIDRLLCGARAELASQPQPVRLPELIHQAVQGFETFRPLRVGDAPDVRLLVDVEAVIGVVGILLENAVTHAPVGSEIAVDARVNGENVLVAVRNAGALPNGLDSSLLFEPFQRGPDATSSGVGLGLSIAARLARSAGGSIDVDSGAGQVTFTLRLPYDVTDVLSDVAVESDERTG